MTSRLVIPPAGSWPYHRLILGILLLSTIAACRTSEEPAPERTPVVPVEVPQKKEHRPFLTDWAGTTWILRNHPQEKSMDFPEYRGFHLGEDGRLLLINFGAVLGDSWSAEGGSLSLNLLAGTPEIPIEGTFLAYVPEGEDGHSQRMLLVPEAESVAESNLGGLVFERAGRSIEVVESYWILRRLEADDSVIRPMTKEIHMILLPDMSGGFGVSGFGGENRFRGDVRLTGETFRTGPIAMTRRYGPMSDVENLYVKRIGEANRFVQVDFDLFLYTDTKPAVAFRGRLFN